MADGELELRRGDADAPAVSIESDPSTLASLLWHGLPIDIALEAGKLRIEGPKRTVTRFMKLLPTRGTNLGPT